MTNTGTPEQRGMVLMALLKAHKAQIGCQYCRDWYATTEKQWKIRQRNMNRVGLAATPYICPSCGSTEWAVSRSRIKPTPLRWWQKLFAWI